MDRLLTDIPVANLRIWSSLTPSVRITELNAANLPLATFEATLAATAQSLATIKGSALTAGTTSIIIQSNGDFFIASTLVGGGAPSKPIALCFKDQPYMLGYQAQDSDPAFGAFAITPNDGVDLATVTRGIYIGVAGSVKVTMADGTVVTFSNVPTGIFPIGAARVWATGTTATSLIGVY